MNGVLGDVRYALRVLGRARGSSAVAVVALALGIGANTAIFSLVEAVLLRPLPYREPQRLVQIWEDASHVGFPRNTPAAGNFFSWKAQSEVFEDAGASRERVLQPHRRGSAPVVLVNEAFARQFLAGEAVGQRIRLGSDEPWLMIVGVVGDVRQMSLEVPSRAEIYIPYQQHTGHGFFSPKDLALRTTGDPMALAPAVRRAIWEVDPNQPVASVRPLEALLDEEVASRNVQASLLGAFAAMALVLAALGLYGVLSYAVTQRRREIGIRMALGAPGGKIVRMVVGHGLTLSMIGLALGLGLALVLMRALSALLYGVGAADPLTYAVVAAALTLVALLASYLPARQAARLDPMITLQAE